MMPPSYFVFFIFIIDVLIFHSNIHGFPISLKYKTPRRWFRIDMTAFLTYIAPHHVTEFFFYKANDKLKTMTLFKQFQRKAIILFAAVCLVVTFTTGLHHHEDNCPHFDCPLCIAGNSLSPGTMEGSVSLFFCLAVTFFLQLKDTFHHYLSIFSIFPNRAPPLS